MPAIKVTSARAWKPNVETVTLPSGNVAKLRAKLPVSLLIKTGRMDDDLFEALSLAQLGALTDSALARRLMALVCEGMFVEPRVRDVEKPPAGVIAYDDLDQLDVDYVVGRGFEGAPHPSFRSDSNGSASSNGSGPVGDEAELDAGDGAGVSRDDAGRPARRPAE